MSYPTQVTPEVLVCLVESCRIVRLLNKNNCSFTRTLEFLSSFLNVEVYVCHISLFLIYSKSITVQPKLLNICLGYPSGFFETKKKYRSPDELLGIFMRGLFQNILYS